MLWVLKRTVSMSSFEHPKHMIKLMGKRIITILRLHFLNGIFFIFQDKEAEAEIDTLLAKYKR